MKEQIREIILALGADVCGFANIDRFNGTPPGFGPADIFSGCKTVVSFGVALPKGLAKIKPRIVYGYFNGKSCSVTDLIAFNSAKIMEKNFNCLAVPVPCDSPYEYWDSEKLEGRGLLSMKHAAVQAGLGAPGKSTMFLNEHYGSMLTLGAVLTDLDLPSDPPGKSICVENCRKCVDACPVNAIGSGAVIQKLCRNNAYGKTTRGFNTVECNRCRVVCPMCYGTGNT